MKLVSKSSLAIVCLSFSFSTSERVFAQDEIIVTAKNQQTISNVLNAAEVFTTSDILATQADDLPALLDRLAGVSFSESGGRGSVTSVFIRGVSNSQIIVLIDGVRVGSATLGAAALNSYPIEAIERVEVLRGPFSGIYGADAVGGVIQLFTKKGGEGIGSLSTTLGSDSLREFGFGINGSGERFSFHLAAQTEETDGIDRTSITADGNDDIDGFEETAFSFGGELQLGEVTTAKLSVLSSDNTAEFDNTFGADPGSFTDTDTLSAALNISSSFDSGLVWSTTLGKNEDESVTTASFSSDFTTERESLGSELGFALGDTAYLTTGVDYYEENVSSTSTTFPVSDRDNKGVYAQLTGELGVVKASTSLRYDDNSAYGSDTNGSVALGLDLGSGYRISASYGTAFVAPSFNFLYFPFFGNPDLLPEESENLEFSVTGVNDVFEWRLTAYQNDIKNLFSFDPNTFLAANVGSAEIKGVEAALSTTLAGWNIDVNADFLSAENQDTGVELDDRAEQTVRLMASKNLGPVELRFDVKHESNRFDNGGTELDSYTLLNLGLNYQINDSLSVAAKVDNVFDEDFTLNLIGATERYRTEGRQAELSLRLTF